MREEGGREARGEDKNGMRRAIMWEMCQRMCYRGKEWATVCVYMTT